MKQDEPIKQYWSKLYLKWVDFKFGFDCEQSLRKYKYKIRVKPNEK